MCTFAAMLPLRSKILPLLLAAMLCLPMAGAAFRIPLHLPMVQTESLEADSSELEDRRQAQQELENARDQMEEMRNEVMIMGGILVLMTIGVGGWLLMKRIRNRD